MNSDAFPLVMSRLSVLDGPKDYKFEHFKKSGGVDVSSLDFCGLVFIYV